jgi:imidazolonepropionase
MDRDLLITNIGQLVTCASGGRVKKGAAMLDIGSVENAAVLVSGGRISLILSGSDQIPETELHDVLDAEGQVVCPGFVDPHTHIVFAGNRLDEFEMKIKGAEYLEILAAGGGIISTVRSTRSASDEELVELGLMRLDRMLRNGTTTCEIKTGYGLDQQAEIKMLRVIEELDKRHPIDIVPTFLAAHAVPPEYRDKPDDYVQLICDTMLPSAWHWFEGSGFSGRSPFFCDVFCERGAFSLEQSRRILETATSLGFGLKAHVDQFSNAGGSRLAIQMGAASVDHLDAISEDEISLLAESRTVGVVIPTENFNAGKTRYADARRMIDAGCSLALSTDYNPGSAPCPSQPMAMAISCRYQKLVPSEAFNAATINAAYAIGLGDQVGSIEVGKRADLLILRGCDFREITYEFGGNLIDTVVKNGRIVPLC